MIISVQMIEHHDKNIFRQVSIPKTQDLIEVLESTFRYGQNHICNVPGLCSVSTGDIIFYNHEPYLILDAGFHKLDKYEYEYYQLINREERRAARFFIYDNVSESSPVG